jgi:DNA polymerase (family 10)
MKKRLVFKKGRFMIARAPSHVIGVFNKVLRWLKPLSKKIEVAGSIRRKEPKPVDIDFVIIPKNKEKIIELMKSKGKFIQGGDKRARFKVDGVKVELYFTTPESWGATLLAYSSRTGSAIGLRMFAKRKGFKLNQYGLFNKRGKRIAGKTEKEIYRALGRKLKKPENR